MVALLNWGWSKIPMNGMTGMHYFITLSREGTEYLWWFMYIVV